MVNIMDQDKYTCIFNLSKCDSQLHTYNVLIMDSISVDANIRVAADAGQTYPYTEGWH